MACIVKQPVGESKGVLVVTDAELRDWLELSPTLRRAFLELKSHWIILLHCNSPVQQRHSDNELIDAYIAGPGDIIWAGMGSPYQIEMDCSNFCPDEFERGPSDGKPFWDLLFVSRNQKFKLISNLFSIVRRIFDEAPIRVLAIVSESRVDRLASAEPIRLYTSMFTEAERKYFTLLSPWIDYPFSFDLPTLAHFYRYSRMFLHTAEHERHPRVVGYAWAAGIPVIAPRSAAALLPSKLACEPGFFPFDSPDEAPELIRRARTYPSVLPPAYMQFHLARFQTARFVEEIRKLYAHLRQPFADGKWFLANLDVRLARHHDRRAGTNSSKASLFQLAAILNGPFSVGVENDPEADIDGAALLRPDEPAVARERRKTMKGRDIRKLRDAYRTGGLQQAAKDGVMILGRIVRYRR